MSQNRNAQLDSSCDPEKSLLAEFGRLWAEADDFGNGIRMRPRFTGTSSADYLTVYESLAQLRGRVLTVLEWGSGLGVVTIMASRMGFEAYGIEAEPDLVEYSENFAQGIRPKSTICSRELHPGRL